MEKGIGPKSFSTPLCSIRICWLFSLGGAYHKRAKSHTVVLSFGACGDCECSISYEGKKSFSSLDTAGNSMGRGDLGLDIGQLPLLDIFPLGLF